MKHYDIANYQKGPPAGTNTSYIIVIYHKNVPLLGPAVVTSGIDDKDAALQVIEGNLSHLARHYDTKELDVLIIANRTVAEILHERGHSV